MIKKELIYELGLTELSGYLQRGQFGTVLMELAYSVIIVNTILMQ
jgi:hypothetical protein